MNAKVKKTLKLVLSAAVALVLLWLAFRTVDWNAFWEGLKQTRWAYIVPFLGASLGALAFRALRWKLLLNADGFRNRWLDVWDADNIGNLGNLAIPGAGELLRCGYVSGKAGYANVLGTVLVERVWDILFIVMMVVLSLVLGQSKFGPFFSENIWEPLAGNLNFSLWWLVAALVVILIVFFWLVFRYRGNSRFCAKIADALSNIGKGFTSFLRMKRKALFLFYTVAIWFMYLLMTLSIQKAMPELSDLGLVDALFFCVLGNIASIIPVPGSMGAYHYLMALAVSAIFAKSWETGILFATLQHELHAVLVLILGAISYTRHSLKKRQQTA
jgi:hypothetical protein